MMPETRSDKKKEQADVCLFRNGGKDTKLFHTSEVEIRKPDISRGRKNADFGQGFYLTPDPEFSLRWAGREAVLNEYELNETGLNILRLQRNEEWFRYIVNNRRSKDSFSADVIIGPIANDTIFDTFGIISSGLLETETAMKLLMIGPEYTQAAVKTEKAIRSLRWIRSVRISGQSPELRKAEQEKYMEEFAKTMQAILG